MMNLSLSGGLYESLLDRPLPDSYDYWRDLYVRTGSEDALARMLERVW